MSKPFRFKEFTVQQNQCAMKVGTDGVLLGAWTSLEHKPNSILDIGTGTGLIALQLAQRSTAEIIDAVELDDSAYEQSVVNFEESAWSDRLFCYHASFEEFVAEMDESYDLIVSNPPFFEEEVSSDDISRNLARQSSALPFEELLEGVAQLLSPSGHFATIIPHKREEALLKLTASFGLHPKRMTHVKGNVNSEIKRSLLEFGRESVRPKIDQLVIEMDRHVYTKEYIELTKPFYLKM